MNRPSLVLAAMLLAAGLGGCPKKWQNGECETSENCREQAGFGKVCVQGRCQECGQDGDCRGGFVCKANRCEPRPECEAPSDCASGKTCLAGRCVAAAPTAECGPDAGGRSCAPGQACESGRCVASTPAPGPCDHLGSVSFAFDSAALSPEARATLEASARCFAEKGMKALRLEGNCDERGTTEYNMHLGQRRADAVKKFLSGVGVPARSISTVSFGKERPVCSEHDETCWRKNRRVDTRSP
ncbi:MAG: OmpA family protein [Deltaproteobacteria bacterium]|nr:OmpA family protein [Deltaproteobacteria bacterium]